MFCKWAMNSLKFNCNLGQETNSQVSSEAVGRYCVILHLLQGACIPLKDFQHPFSLCTHNSGKIIGK